MNWNHSINFNLRNDQGRSTYVSPQPFTEVGERRNLAQLLTKMIYAALLVGAPILLVVAQTWLQK